jgi:hypothetical protein
VGSRWNTLAIRLQKSEDDALPREQRVGIGGDLFAWIMGRDENGASSILTKWFMRFDDFETAWDVMLAKLPQNEGFPHSQAILAAYD